VCRADISQTQKRLAVSVREIDRAFTPLVEVERNQAPLRAYGEEE